MLKIKITNAGEIDKLLTSEQYHQLSGQ
ncbi:MAG: hypothetical protein IPM04_12985 [Saprospiraceae bacterium]|nr:hypothetical protein [Candidatus Brachybacter algidus]